MKKIIIITTFLLSFSALAGDGSSGCGPGWYLFKKNSLVSSALRATTNAALFPFVTLGMTLGTSNCSKHQIVKTEQESLKFVTENYYEIATDAAKGEGDFLTSLASTIGCKKEDISIFGKKLKSNLQKIYDANQANPERMLKETYLIILNDKRLLQSCSLG